MIAMLLIGTGEAEIRASWSYGSRQVLPAVHRASVPWRDDVIECTRDPEDKPGKHGAVTEGNGHQRPAVIWLHGCTADADTHLRHGTVARSECSGWRGPADTPRSTSMFCLFFLHFFWHASLGVRSAKRRQQSPERTMIASFRERFLDFRSCWIVFIHVVRGHHGGLQISKEAAVKIFLAPVSSLIRALWPNGEMLCLDNGWKVWFYLSYWK